MIILNFLIFLNIRIIFLIIKKSLKRFNKTINLKKYLTKKKNNFQKKNKWNKKKKKKILTKKN